MYSEILPTCSVHTIFLQPSGAKDAFPFLFLFFIPSLALSLRLAPCQNTTCRFRFLGFAISILHCPIISTCVSSFLRRPYIPASNKLHSKQACTTAPLAQCIGPASLDRRSGVILVILPLLMSSQTMDTEPYMGIFHPISIDESK